MASKLSQKSMNKMIEAGKHLQLALELVCSLPEEQYQEVKKVFRTKTGKEFTQKADQLPASVLSDVRDIMKSTIKDLQ